MLPEIPAEEFAAALDACVDDLLWEAGVGEPPVDATVVAERLGMVVAKDLNLPGRARFVRLRNPRGDGHGQPTIIVGPAERPEREQWAVAHEIGESVAHRVFDMLSVDPQSALPDAREIVANHLAGCLLLPHRWFAVEGVAVDWDLFQLKRCFTTASHELIARRMLEMPTPIVITICDLGQVSWRWSNVAARPPQMLPAELDVWREAHATGLPTAATLDADATGLESIRCWPIHEPGWQREILRSEITAW